VRTNSEYITRLARDLLVKSQRAGSRIPLDEAFAVAEAFWKRFVELHERELAEADR
jgi:hypothetical protein